MTRDFLAPREKVWRAWTTPKAFVRWLGPRHWPAIEVQAEVRPGGAWRTCGMKPIVVAAWSRASETIKLSRFRQMADDYEARIFNTETRK
jgi:hypothetical protein